MQFNLLNIGSDVWGSMVKGYQVQTILPIDITRKKLCNDNARSMSAITNGLPYFEYIIVMHCTTTKEAWENFKTSTKVMTMSNKLRFKYIYVSLKL